MNCDIAIVGGGLVGASLACALDSLGYRVIVLEKVTPRASAQPSYDDRTLALSHSSCQILTGLGLWDALAEHATPIREIIVTEFKRPGRVVLRASESGLEAFGNVVEARSFGKVVLERLAGLTGVELHCPATLLSLRQHDDCVELEVEGANGTQSISARLLVAADGAASSVRGVLGISTQERDYGQTAVICNITPAEEHRGRAFERLTPTGPFAVLPHVGQRCGLVWTVPGEQAQSLLEAPGDEFLALAQQRFGMELGTFLKAGKRSSYPLRLVRASRDTDRRCVIMGNAAHAIHPAGAQGFNLGLRDVAVLAEVLASAEGIDPGDPGLIDTYSRWRKPDHDETVDWTDGLVRLFANPSVPAAALRTTGMLLHGVLPPLRRRLASKAMGYRGKTPRLALGLPLRN